MSVDWKTIADVSVNLASPRHIHSSVAHETEAVGLDLGFNLADLKNACSNCPAELRRGVDALFAKVMDAGTRSMQLR